jgi:hypothetical protein
MKNSKFLLATLVAFVVFFVVGWAVYDLLLKDFYQANSGLQGDLYHQVFKDQSQMTSKDMGTAVISNLAGALMLTTILMWGGFTSAAAGARAAAIIGLLMAMSIDFGFMSFTNMFTMKGSLIDILVNTIMCSISGACAGMVLGRRTTSTAAA